MIEKYSVIYDDNKKLDKVFIEKYYHDDFVKKNKLELLVEIGELANETRCFKYWSKKDIDHELVGYELADTIIMTLCFFNYLNIDLKIVRIDKIDRNIIDLFFEVYELATKFSQTEDNETIIKLFVLLINIGYYLGFTDDEIVEFCHNKIKKDLERI